MLWGNSKHTLDLIQEKEARLCSLKDKSSMAIQLVQQTVSDLDTVNQEIAETVDEINEYISRLADTHDICKTNFYKKGTRNVKENGQWVTKEVYEIDEKFPCGHGEKSVIILQNFIHLSAEEIYAIRAHMGGFDTSVKGGDYFIGKIFEKSKLALLLHVADMKATYLLEG